jgi:cytosine deaminase
MTPIAVGNAADFIWFDAADLGDLISRPAAERVVYRAGRKVAPVASRREPA